MGGVGMEKAHLQQQVLPIGQGGLQGAPQAGGSRPVRAPRGLLGGWDAA